MKPDELRPCPYCLQLLVKFDRHVKRCPKFDAAAQLVTCPCCVNAIALFNMRRHLRACRIVHAQLSTTDRERLRVKYEQLERRIQRRKKRSKKR
jgi:hypothetical protein